MESRQNYWVQLLSLPPEDRQRFMLVLDLVAHRLIFRGEKGRMTIIHQEEGDSYGNFNQIMFSPFCHQG